MPLTEPIVAIEEPTFKLFPKLALELRLMIWERSIPGARLISIRGSSVSQDDTYAAPRRAEVASSEVMPLKGMLQACQNSRRTIQKTYTLALHHRLSAPIYIDFDRDALFFTDASAIRDFFPFSDLRPIYMKEVQEKALRIMLGFQTWEGRNSQSRGPPLL
ncbi:hypothetical protein BKA64DRAFT_665024 [Cadophora sp. MPI-SDFR-AT-0126]|nr:hypothetical protein BKA64DRAFT_665024 [Leotiomycetes sp. MPI-SDFR-AT-0126]